MNKSSKTYGFSVKIALLVLGLILLGLNQSRAQDESVAIEEITIEENRADFKPLAIEDFIEKAAANDKVFEEILVDELVLSYRKDLFLPARDFILEVKGQYDVFFDQGREDADVSVSLSKLFPFTGTDIEVGYLNAPSLTTDTMNSEFNALISQPIAQNAFGAATRLQDKILGIEIDVIRYQIIEAYEDYLASLINLYYNWYSAYERLQIGEASYRQNLTLLENMQKRAQNKIALPVDVNKVNLLVMSKEENVITLRREYRRLFNLIVKAIRYDVDKELIPMDPSAFHVFDIDFQKDYRSFTESSRTYDILKLLEDKSSMQVRKNADALLPSTNLLIGYKLDGRDWPIRDEDSMFYVGVEISWPFNDQVDQATYQTSRIDYRKKRLTNQNKYFQLETDLKNLYEQAKRDKELIALASQKIELAELVLKDESRNYSFGKITLNDYIDAVNKLDENRFNKILYTVELKKRILEWLRLSDQLIRKKDIDWPK